MTRVKVDIDPKGILDGIGLGVAGKAQRFLNSEVLRISDPFVPFRDGFLKNSGVEDPSGTSVSYNMPYARRLWYGDDFKFSGAPVRGSRWVERAWAIEGDMVLKNIQEGINKGVFR